MPDKIYCLSLGGIPFSISSSLKKMHKYAKSLSSNVSSYETVARNIRKVDFYSTAIKSDSPIVIIITTVKEI